MLPTSYSKPNTVLWITQSSSLGPCNMDMSTTLAQLRNSSFVTCLTHQ